MDDQTGKTVALRDGRVLGVAEYGAPDGNPILYFHGHPGARIEWPVFGDDECAKELGLRILAVDRPGHGRSSFQRRRRMLDWPRDVLEFAGLLHLERFGILGVSGGAPYALACAHQIPEPLTAVAIVSGMGPADAPGTTEGLSWTYAGKGAISRRILLKLVSLGVQKQPEKFAAQMSAGLDGPDKALLLADPEIALATAAVFKEALREGIAGAHIDAGIYTHPWGFRLDEIDTEIHLWHGKQDGNVLPSVARHVVDLLPNCQATFVENEGHLSLSKHHAQGYLGFLADSAD